MARVALRRLGGSGSVVEHLLAKERVTGSNPVFRSLQPLQARCGSFLDRPWRVFGSPSCLETPAVGARNSSLSAPPRGPVRWPRRPRRIPPTPETRSGAGIPATKPSFRGPTSSARPAARRNRRRSMARMGSWAATRPLMSSGGNGRPRVNGLSLYHTKSEHKRPSVSSLSWKTSAQRPSPAKMRPLFFPLPLETFAKLPRPSNVRLFLLPLPLGEGWGEGLPGNHSRVTQRSLSLETFAERFRHSRALFRHSREDGNLASPNLEAPRARRRCAVLARVLQRSLPWETFAKLPRPSKDVAALAPSPPGRGLG